MSETRQILESIIDDFSTDKFTRFFRAKSQKFTPRGENYGPYNDENFIKGQKIGEVNFTDTDILLICAFGVTKSLSERAGKKSQYDKAKNILKSSGNQKYSGGIFIFYDQSGNFRFSLVYPESSGIRRQWNNFRRFTYFVSREFTNKTFLKQIGDKEFGGFEDIRSSFSISAVTDLFYDEFFKIYDKIVKETKDLNGIDNETVARDFILLFSIRTIFLGFIQKKKWLGADDRFIENFYQEYKDNFYGNNDFYNRWLSPLFFEALNSPPGRKVAFGNNEYSKEIEAKLQMAPYLNGGLFRKKQGYDSNGWIISDEAIERFFNFLFSHSFTIEENSLEDEDLQLNPEFLGIIFERLVNKADGAVYTPRPEVDLMCRLSLVKWLEKKQDGQIKSDNLYELFFKESEKEEDQKQGSFSLKEAQEVLDILENMAVCDPAVGSGAFLVGMMQVLDDVEQSLRKRYGLNGKTQFDRKKQIIKSSLYGVEVKEWAVWICQLRLWLSLFVDAPDDLRHSLDPILPSLDFKVRQGDSLVQRVGSKAFPVSGHNATLSKSIKDKITKLRNLKLQYFDNKSELKDWELRHREKAIYEEILSSEVNEKVNEIKILKNIKPAKKLSLFGIELPEPEQVSLLQNPEKVKLLESEIADLEDMRKLLSKGEKPLVWSIEFADVFGEKGGFDIVIGNPPYVRHEDIADPTGRVRDKKEYKGYLQEMVKMDFPDYFPPKTKINAQSDLYTYFYIRALRLLNMKGIQTFICSNSWLDVGYGVWLQEFLLSRCPVEMIIDNHAKRSFDAADVNTIISIIHAPQKKVDDNHTIKFVAFKKPFESVVFTENLTTLEKTNEVVSNENFRVYPITNVDLKEVGMEYEEGKTVKTGKYVGDKWGGKYLRAPDIYWKIILKNRNKFKHFKEIANLKRGFTTGANDFFYPSKSVVEQWKIEKQFLKPVIKSPQECKSLFINIDNLETQVFVCNKDIAELKGTNAAKYIHWGESASITVKQGGSKGNTVKGYQNLETTKNRPRWYDLGIHDNPHAVWVKSVNVNHLQSVLDCDALVDQRLYEVSFTTDMDKDVIAIILNNSILYLFKEIEGRSNMGEGVLDTAVYETKRILLVNPELVASNLSTISRDYVGRSVFEEFGIDPESDIPIEEQNPTPLSDRVEMDSIIFDVLELTEGERKDVYRAVCRLVWNRINRAHSV